MHLGCAMLKDNLSRLTERARGVTDVVYDDAFLAGHVADHGHLGNLTGFLAAFVNDRQWRVDPLGKLTRAGYAADVWGRKPLFSSQYRAFFWAALFAAPSLILIADDDYVWFYVPMWFVATFLLHKVGTTLSPPLMVYLVMYATLVSVMVFSLKEEFNSFYTALSAATFVVFFVLVIRNFAYY